MGNVKLGDYIEEYSERNKDEKDIPVYSVTNEEGFCTGYFNKDVSSKDKRNYKIVPYGFFAYNPSRINVGSIDWQKAEEMVLVSPLYVVFKVKEDINQQYLLHYFKSDVAKQYIKNMAAGSVRDNLKFSALKEFPFALRDLEEQEEIAAKIDKITGLVEKAKLLENMYDELVKSRFIEMFGDLLKEQYTTVESICEIITDGTHQPPKFSETGIPFLFVSNIVKNVITYNTEKFITKETYADLIKRTPIEIGDVLLSTVGSYGHSAVVKSEKQFCFQRHIAYLKPKKSLINSDYFHSALLSENVQQQMKERVKGIAQKTLNLSEIRKISLPLPSLKLQQQFAAFAQQADKSKLAVKQSLEKLETLKKALMQQYFG